MLYCSKPQDMSNFHSFNWFNLRTPSYKKLIHLHDLPRNTLMMAVYTKNLVLPQW